MDAVPVTNIYTLAASPAMSEVVCRNQGMPVFPRTMDMTLFMSSEAAVCWI